MVAMYVLWNNAITLWTQPRHSPLDYTPFRTPPWPPFIPFLSHSLDRPSQEVNKLRSQNLLCLLTCTWST